ncbi:Cytochrome c-type biogenesis protein DsbD, protein-disulfide reductase [Lysobacter capsici AZ78]|uniref:Thiol:disulfide interchange protein DsbD n=1 Tax=Lysobacter capsici AZ78 TaxID=1444315 RepID=A0A108U8S0_9GAMM|nr:protein-disulfide reductase DsbD [Lysobacter capsici]KWS04648.1 Cytochrome c-type biogenesis protein DsbD, protein-disulfide reductase [Lysobacter capsici AZ78]
MTDDLLPGRRRRAGHAFALALATSGLAAAFAAPALAVDEKDLLPVDDAFAVSASAPSAERIAIDWKIAKGYYLYKHRISVKTDAGYAARPLQLPKGEAHKDEFFGDVETYRDRLSASLPGSAQGASVKLTVKYQGCADAGICYPPQTRTLNVALPAAAAAASGPAMDPAPASAPLVQFGPRGGASNPLLGGGSPLSAPSAASAGATDALPLPPEQAFGFEAIARDGDSLLLRFTPARGYYLYRDKTSLKTDHAAIAAGKPQWPRGTAHRDEHFGQVTVFFDQIDVPLPLIRKTADAARITLTAGFQGCQTDGICYPPMTRKVTIDLARGTVTAAVDASKTDPAAGTAAGAATAATAAATAAAGNADTAAGTPASSTDSANPATGAASADPGTTQAGASLAGSPNAADQAADTAAPQAEDSLLAASLAGPNRYLALLTFFGLGLLLAFTPCVLPMIPILSGLIVGQGPGLSARRAFTLSLIYVLANAAVFTVAGVIVGLLGAGSNVQILFQTPWVISVFALVFVSLALSSFGLYELQLPSGLRNWLSEVSNRQRSGSWLGVAAMGALSSLIVGPCVAPPLAGAVLYISQTGDPLFGGLVLFTLALGMGVPLLVFGVAAGKGLPTSGPWMVAVQRVFGLIFIGMAIWMLSRILPGPVILALWGALALGAAVLIALSLRAARGDGARAIGWLCALLFGVLGAAQLFGALAGGSDPLRPLAGLRGGAAAHPAELPFRTIKSSADLDRELAAAQAAGKPLMLDFYADWCVACKEMEKYTFPEPQVQRALDGFVLLKADVTANDELDQALMKRLGIIGPPATLYYSDGAERRELRLFGFEKAPAFAARIDRARAAHR